MRKLSQSSSIHLFILDLLYLWARLDANPATKAFAGHVLAQIERMDEVKRRIEAAERDQVRSLAARDHADDTLDDLLRQATKKAEAAIGDRRAPDFQRVFATTASEIVALPMIEEVRAAELLADKLETSGIPALVELAPGIRAASAALKASEEAWKSSFQPVALAGADRDYEKAQSNVLRDKTYGQLIATFPGQRARTEGFFRESKGRGAGDREDTATPKDPET